MIGSDIRYAFRSLTRQKFATALVVAMLGLGIAAAKTFFPSVDDPVGRRVRGTSHTAPFNRVIGVVADVKHYGLERPMRPGVYWPLPLSAQGIDTMAVALKTAGDPGRVAAAARAAVTSSQACCAPA